jgi:hypothetical protein
MLTIFFVVRLGAHPPTNGVAPHSDRHIAGRSARQFFCYSCTVAERLEKNDFKNSRNYLLRYDKWEHHVANYDKPKTYHIHPYPILNCDPII